MADDTEPATPDAAPRPPNRGRTRRNAKPCGVARPRRVEGGSDLADLAVALEIEACRCRFTTTSGVTWTQFIAYVSTSLLGPVRTRAAAERDYSKPLPPPERLLATVYGLEACCHTDRPHTLPLERWIELLLTYDAAGYCERPPPEPHAGALTHADRVALYTARAARGEGLWHPRDGEEANAPPRLTTAEEEAGQDRDAVLAEARRLGAERLARMAARRSAAA